MYAFTYVNSTYTRGLTLSSFGISLYIQGKVIVMLFHVHIYTFICLLSIIFVYVEQVNEVILVCVLTALGLSSLC